MRNITVSVPEDVYRRARIKAAELDTSVSKLVGEYLIDLANTESEFERLARLESELRVQVSDFSASERLSREDVHERNQ